MRPDQGGHTDSLPCRRRLVVVSGFGDDLMTPRGQRTQQLIKVLGTSWDVELIAMPSQEHRGGGATTGRSLARRLASQGVRHTLYDRWEPWARRRFAHWRPEADAALLVVAPWSPAAVAAPQLSEHGIPYVLDAGDPWSGLLKDPKRTFAGRRALRGEAPIFKGASGALLTTRQQAVKTRARYPALPIMVRSNGYEDPGFPLPGRPPAEPGVLRLAHLGVIYAARLDPMPLLRRLQASGRWRTIRFEQYGADPEGMLADAPAGVEVRNHTAIPWREVIARSDEFDATVVLGNHLGECLPSKAVQYLTLPVPRIAITDPERDDALTDFAGAHTAWLAVAPDDPDAAAKIAAHVAHPWTADDLAPPEADSWSSVATDLAAFFEDCIVGSPVVHAQAG